MLGRVSGQEIALVRAPSHVGLAHLEAVADQARDYAAAARAKNTIRAYRADWADFTSWCDQLGLHSLPATADTVALYLTSHAVTKKTSTLQRRLSAISQAHKTAGLESPIRSAAVRLVWAGIRRKHGTAQEGKAPTLVEDLRSMVRAMAPRRRGQDWRLLELRDRALLLLGFAGAFRRSELVGLDVEDLEFSRAGLVVLLRRSKTDQEGQGRKIGVPRGQRAETCPLVALQTYLKVASIESGPLFRGVNRHSQLQPSRLSDRAVALVVKRRVEAIGLDPERFAGHSLRAGLATSAAAAGASERAIANQTGHKSMAVLRRYIRDGDLFRDNAAAAVDL
jgi:site-specific recombinase XerD